MPVTQVIGPIFSFGQSLSSVVDLRVGKLIQINTSEGWTPAHLTAQVSADGTEFFDLYDPSGREIVLDAIGPGRAIPTPDSWPEDMGYMRFRSGKSGSPIAQNQGRVFSCVLLT